MSDDTDSIQMKTTAYSPVLEIAFDGLSGVVKTVWNCDPHAGNVFLMTPADEPEPPTVLIDTQAVLAVSSGFHDETADVMVRSFPPDRAFALAASVILQRDQIRAKLESRLAAAQEIRRHAQALAGESPCHIGGSGDNR